MSTTHTSGFQAQLTEAIAERDAARARYESFPTFNKAKRDAGEDLEFWMGKVAFLAAAVEREG